MPQTNKLTIYINGLRYPIKTAEEPEYVAALAQELDTMVRELMAAGTASLNEALVLAALGSLDERRKAEAAADNLRAQVTGYVEDAAKARLEVGELKRELEKQRRSTTQGAKS